MQKGKKESEKGTKGRNAKNRKNCMKELRGE